MEMATDTRTVELDPVKEIGKLYLHAAQLAKDIKTMSDRLNQAHQNAVQHMRFAEFLAKEIAETEIASREGLSEEVEENIRESYRPGGRRGRS